MKNTYFIALCSLIASCGSVTVPYKEGGSISDYKRVVASCELEAVQSIPRKVGFKKTPLVHVPEVVECVERTLEDESVSKVCTKTGGYTTGGELIEVDLNSEARGQYAQLCVAKHGYTQVTLPRCSKRQKINHISVYNKQFNKISENTCVTNIQNGVGWFEEERKKEK